MNILAFDCSSRVGSVAISVDGRVAFRDKIDSQITHSQRLIPQIDKALKHLKLPIEEIDLIVVSIGPGSFMGIRIGLTTAKAICFSKQIPLQTFSTLEVMAFDHFGKGADVIPIIPARGGYIYGACYNSLGKVKIEPTFQLADDFFRVIKSDFILAGNKLDEVKSILSNKKYKCVKKELNLAPILLKMAKPSCYNYKKISLIEPLYLQKSQAEKELGKRKILG